MKKLTGGVSPSSLFFHLFSAAEPNWNLLFPLIIAIGRISCPYGHRTTSLAAVEHRKPTGFDPRLALLEQNDVPPARDEAYWVWETTGPDRAGPARAVRFGAFIVIISTYFEDGELIFIFPFFAFLQYSAHRSSMVLNRP
jgi:hypothetical protein